MASLRQCLYINPIKDFDKFLSSSVFYKELYSTFWSVRDSEYRWKVSNLETFNEWLYQCTRVYIDPHPEDDFYCKYLEDAKNSLGTRYASNLIFAMVRATMKVLKKKPDGFDFFMMAYDDRCSKLMTPNVYTAPFDAFAENFVSKYGYLNMQFPLHPFMDIILPWSPFSAEDWRDVTSNFDQSRIEEILSTYKSIDFREELVNVIESSYEEIEGITDAKNIPDLPF